MARRQFEIQAARRRNGDLANAALYVVYSDASGTVAADIAASVDGTPISGSVVTTTDISGLGPGSVRFYGPPSDVDTLYVRSSSDATLGIQKIRSDFDERLDALEISAADVAALDGRADVLESRVVYVKDYVPDPDGTTENYTGLAAAITAASGKVLEFEQNKTYVHSTALAPLSNTLIRGNGATLKCGAAKTGTMASSGRQIEVAARNGVIVEGLQFVAPLTAHGALSGHVATVRLNGSTNCKVRDCTFTSTGVTNGVFVNGANSADNKVENNYLDAAAITYSEDGASRTTCRGNTVRNAVGNGLSGSGNNGIQDNTDCLVEANRVLNCGRFGIEDVSNTYGTKIRDNVVRTSAMYGISAVGRNALIEGNTVIDAGDKAIECGSNGTQVLGNNVRWIGGGVPGSGVIVNGTASATPKGITVSGNYIEGAQSGVQLYGAQVYSAAVHDNVILNPITYGIRTDATLGRPSVEGNVIRFNIPSVNNTAAWRYGIYTIHPTPIKGNTIVWEPGAAGGTVNDTGICLAAGSDYSTVEGNLLDAGSVASPAVPLGVSANGATPTGVRIRGNTFLGGATLDRTGLTAHSVAGNTGTTSGVTVSKEHGGVVVGTAALATTATDGFLYIPTCAGTPTGVPTTQTGTVPLIFDTTNAKLYVFSGGSWKGGTAPGAFS